MPAISNVHAGCRFPTPGLQGAVIRLPPSFLACCIKRQILLKKRQLEAGFRITDHRFLVHWFCFARISKAHDAFLARLFIFSHTVHDARDFRHTQRLSLLQRHNRVYRCSSVTIALWCQSCRAHGRLKEGAGGLFLPLEFETWYFALKLIRRKTEQHNPRN